MEITIDTNGTSESLSVLKYENRWTTEEYIRELVAGCYIVKEYFDIAINEIKLQGMINLRKFLQLELSYTRNKLHKKNFMSMMRDLEMLNVKYIEDICDLYHIEYSCPYVEKDLYLYLHIFISIFFLLLLLGMLKTKYYFTLITIKYIKTNKYILLTLNCTHD